MIRHTLAVLSLALIAGCTTEMGIKPLSSDATGASEPTQLAAAAAVAEYPSDAEANDDLKAAAIVYRDAKTVEIINFSNQTLTNAKVWVNGSFVYNVPSIPANSAVMIRRADMYDAAGNNLSSYDTTVQKVELQTGDNLYLLQGPAFK